MAFNKTLSYKQKNSYSSRPDKGCKETIDSEQSYCNEKHVYTCRNHMCFLVKIKRTPTFQNFTTCQCRGSKKWRVIMGAQLLLPIVNIYIELINIDNSARLWRVNYSTFLLWDSLFKSFLRKRHPQWSQVSKTNSAIALDSVASGPISLGPVGPSKAHRENIQGRSI